MEENIKPLINQFIERSLSKNSLATTDIIGNQTTYKWLKIKMSFGMWSYAKITWISFLREWEKTSDGIYPVILLNTETKDFVVSYWISETSKPENSRENIDKATIWEQLQWGRYKDSSIESVYAIDEENKTKNIENIETSLNNVIEEYLKLKKRTTGDNIRYRMYSPGELAKNWEEFLQEWIMGIWWDLGDQSKLKTRDEIKKKYIQVNGKEQNNNILACYQFSHELKPWDIIIVKKWREILLWYGIVESDYIFDDSRTEYKSIRRVKRYDKWEIPHDRHKVVLKTLTDVTKYEDYVIYLKNLLGILDTSSPTTMAHTDNKHDLNTILYWVPWTGKTYNTINYAVAMVEWKSISEVQNESREEVKKRFEKYKQAGQVVFCSFHQSLSYEEFIEWIRANTDDSGNVSYEIADWIFKDIAKKAKQHSWEVKWNEVDLTNLLNRFWDYINSTIEKWDIFVLHNQWATIAEILLDSNWNIKSFVTWGTVNRQHMTKSIIERDYLNFLKWTLTDYTQIKPSWNSEREFHGNARYYFYLMEKIKEFAEKEEIKIDDIKNNDTEKNYVLIIDEINRWNMSKIFGELITLLEESKRLWAQEELTVQLPYSKEEFGVPQNLYVIGTMNTTDRSIALIDIALRRRFSFKEMQPNSWLLENITVGNINIQRLFETINTRIEFLYDRDHLIGHSFFLKLQKNPTLQNLNAIFGKEIIPLLQEYFYEDREKIQIILWDHKEQKSKNEEDRIIQEKNQSEVAVIWFNHDELENKSSYTINQNPSEQSYIWIYATLKNENKE